MTAPNKRERVAVRNLARGLEGVHRAQYTTQVWLPCWCDLGEERRDPGFILINLQELCTGP